MVQSFYSYRVMYLCFIKFSTLGCLIHKKQPPSSLLLTKCWNKNICVENKSKARDKVLTRICKILKPLVRENTGVQLIPRYQGMYGEHTRLVIYQGSAVILFQVSSTRRKMNNYLIIRQQSIYSTGLSWWKNII